MYRDGKVEERDVEDHVLVPTCAFHTHGNVTIEGDIRAHLLERCRVGPLIGKHTAKYLKLILKAPPLSLLFVFVSAFFAKGYTLGAPAPVPFPWAQAV